MYICKDVGWWWLMEESCLTTWHGYHGYQQNTYRLCEKELPRGRLKVFLPPVLVDDAALQVLLVVLLLLLVLRRQQGQLGGVSLQVHVHSLLIRLPRKHCTQRALVSVTTMRLWLLQFRKHCAQINRIVIVLTSNSTFACGSLTMPTCIEQTSLPRPSSSN